MQGCLSETLVMPIFHTVPPGGYLISYAIFTFSAWRKVWKCAGGWPRLCLKFFLWQCLQGRSLKTC